MGRWQRGYVLGCKPRDTGSIPVLLSFKFKAMEIWKPIAGYKSLYEVSSEGQIKGLKRNNLLKYGINNKGYQLVTLWKDNVQKTYLVHRLVAGAFIPNKYGYPQVNHKDSCKTNNSAINLEWSTGRFNVQHSIMSKTFMASRLKIG